MKVPLPLKGSGLSRATAMAIGPVAFFIKLFNDEQFLVAVHDALAQAKNS